MTTAPKRLPQQTNEPGSKLQAWIRARLAEARNSLMTRWPLSAGSCRVSAWEA